MTSYDKNDPQTIQEMFSSIASNYDRTNAVLSFQLHKRWNKELVRRVIGTSNSGPLLDLCCGTGDITFTYLKGMKKPCQIYMLDFCDEMLKCAKMKAQKLCLPSDQKLAYVHADAQAIPLPHESVDYATIAYGIRNVKDPNKCVEEVYRVLRPGGVFGILELTQPQNIILRKAHQLYLRAFLPVIGKCLTSNQEAYRYLCSSIYNFMKPEEIKQVLINRGFHEVTSIPLILGIASILIAKK